VVSITREYGQTNTGTVNPPPPKLLDNLPAGVVATDAAGEVIWGNQTAGDLVGSVMDFHVGRPLGAVLRVDFDIDAIVRQVIAEEIVYNNQEATLINRFDQTVDVGITIAPLVPNGDDVVGATVLVQDHTGLRRHVERSRHAQRLQDLGAMSAMIAHEVKNPLGAIRGVAQVLAGECDREDQHEGLEVILREVDRLTMLLDDVLGVARAELHGRRPVNIHRVLDRVVDLLRRDIGDPTREPFVSEYDPSLPDVAGSEDRLVQLFFNLVKNGLEASPPGVPVTVRTRLSPTRMVLGSPKPGGARMLLVTVTDQGAGILPEHRARLFTPFFTTKRHGTGLGLALCARIVEEHGGEIRFPEVRRGGTRVEVYLPFANRVA
jgi:two-component system nitrogen regulation sensor histidine kinase GlnL